MVPPELEGILPTELGGTLPTVLAVREVESLLRHPGADIEPSHGARFKVTLNGVTDFLHHPHHGNECTRDLIRHLREFLSHAGVSASAYEMSREE